jgi:hypothetical protein
MVVQKNDKTKIVPIHLGNPIPLRFTVVPSAVNSTSKKKMRQAENPPSPLC